MNLFSFSDHHRIQGCHPNVNGGDELTQHLVFAILVSQVCPLAEHIDLKDHYLAFIELENFGIATDLPDERYYSERGNLEFQLMVRLSVRQLKDTIQLTLLQQSEYLRRFSLTFCEKVRISKSLSLLLKF